MKHRSIPIQLMLPGLEWVKATGQASAKEVVSDAFRELELIYERASDLPPTGLPFGFSELDRRIVGLRRADMTVIASRPGVGKTLFTLHVAYHVAEKYAVPILIFTPGTKRTSTIMRLWSFVGNIPANSFITGNVEEDDWPKCTITAGRLADAPIFIDDSPIISPELIKYKAARIQDRMELGLIIVDSLEHVLPSHSTNDKGIDHCERARSLKSIARHLNVPLMLTASVDCSLVDGDIRQPSTSDLNDQCIAIFADLILLLHRERVTLHAGKQRNDRVLLSVNIAKNRSGPTGCVRLVMDQQFLKLTNSNNEE